MVASSSPEGNLSGSEQIEGMEVDRMMHCFFTSRAGSTPKQPPRDRDLAPVGGVHRSAGSMERKW
jgi:hypothetical protein